MAAWGIILGVSCSISAYFCLFAYLLAQRGRGRLRGISKEAPDCRLAEFEGDVRDAAASAWAALAEEEHHVAIFARRYRLRRIEFDQFFGSTRAVESRPARLLDWLSYANRPEFVNEDVAYQVVMGRMFLILLAVGAVLLWAPFVVAMILGAGSGWARRLWDRLR